MSFIYKPLFSFLCGLNEFYSTFIYFYVAAQGMSQLTYFFWSIMLLRSLTLVCAFLYPKLVMETSFDVFLTYLVSEAIIDGSILLWSALSPSSRAFLPPTTVRLFRNRFSEPAALFLLWLRRGYFRSTFSFSFSSGSWLRF